MDFYTNVFNAGKYMYVRGVEDGRRIQRKEIYMPSLFFPTTNETKYKTIHGEPVERKVFDDPKDARDHILSYKGVHGFRYFGYTEYTYPYISDTYGTIEFDANKKEQLNIGFLDIEVESANGFPEPAEAKERINAVGIFFKDKYHVFGLEHAYTPKSDDVIYYQCLTEVELLQKFLRFWKDSEFDVITGWNVDAFDMTYIITRSNKILGEDKTKEFSPWGWIREQTVKKHGRESIRYNISGLSVIDYLDIYRKSPAIPQRESYKLDYIATVELGEQKISYDDYGSLYSLYENNWELFIDYNIKDVELVKRLDDKLKLLDLTFTMAYDAGINFVDVSSQTKSWDVLIYNELRSRNMVIPSKQYLSEMSDGYAGAYVKEPLLGLHDWVVSFDLASLYPHLIMQYSISPETIVDSNDLTSRIRHLESLL